MDASRNSYSSSSCESTLYTFWPISIGNLFLFFFFSNSIEFNCGHMTSYLLLDVSHFFLVRLRCTVQVENVCVTQIKPEIVQKWHRQQEETHDNPSIVHQEDFRKGLTFKINYFLSAVHVFVSKFWINRSKKKLKTGNQNTRSRYSFSRRTTFFGVYDSTESSLLPNNELIIYFYHLFAVSSPITATRVGRVAIAQRPIPKAECIIGDSEDWRHKSNHTNNTTNNREKVFTFCVPPSTLLLNGSFFAQ